MDTSETKKSLDPKISIIIPFFNSESTLKRAVDSVISQSFSEWELILVNDGSSDQSERIAKSYLEDQRISYIYQENKGVSAARNLGASKAKADWLIFLDSDDTFLADSIKNFFFYIGRFNDNTDIVFSSYYLIKNGKLELYASSRLAGSYCIKKYIFFEIGGFDEKMTYGENSELIRRAKLKGLKFQKANFVSLKYFESKNGGSKNLLNMIQSNEYLLEKYSDFFECRQYEKAVYLQVIGVALLRLGEFEKAQKYFLESVKIRFLKPQYWFRLFLSSFPFLSRKIYPLKRSIQF